MYKIHPPPAYDQRCDDAYERPKARFVGDPVEHIAGVCSWLEMVEFRMLQLMPGDLGPDPTCENPLLPTLTTLTNIDELQCWDFFVNSLGCGLVRATV